MERIKIGYKQVSSVGSVVRLVLLAGMMVKTQCRLVRAVGYKLTALGCLLLFV